MPLARALRRAAVALATILAAAAPVLRAQTPAGGAAERRAAPAAARWTRGATCYEVFVRSFADSDGDGVGDLRGLTAHLDYLNDGDPQTTTDLGVRCVWLMPVAESPSYHGYDVSNHYRVEPDYGTNEDFRAFVAAAHRRGVRVLVDMVLNHASSEHPHFRSALADPLSPYREWFVFSPTKPDLRGVWNQEVWHRSPLRDEWYYGLFWRGMPDLNYRTPAVRAEAARVARFWLTEMGVDGFRLDAVPFLVEDGRQLFGTPGTHQVLREYAAAVRRLRPDAYTVGEVWDSVGAQLPYYPDQLDAYFTFELSDSLLAAVRRGTAGGMLAPVLRLQRLVPPSRYAPFLRNHDQSRTATVLGADSARLRLAATLLLTLPGVPFVYYGEELGMRGDKPDERLRTPMPWAAAGPHAGFTTGTPWQPLQADSLTANVGAQTGDAGSLLALYRRLIHLRDTHPALAGGELVPLRADHPGVAAYLRREGGRAVLVVANLDSVPAAATLASEPGALPAGRYAARGLLGGPDGPALATGADGRVRGYAPGALPPRSARVYDLAAER